MALLLLRPGDVSINWKCGNNTVGGPWRQRNCFCGK